MDGQRSQDTDGRASHKRTNGGPHCSPAAESVKPRSRRPLRGRPAEKDFPQERQRRSPLGKQDAVKLATRKF